MPEARGKELGFAQLLFGPSGFLQCACASPTQKLGFSFGQHPHLHAWPPTGVLGKA